MTTRPTAGPLTESDFDGGTLRAGETSATPELIPGAVSQTLRRATERAWRDSVAWFLLNLEQRLREERGDDALDRREGSSGVAPAPAGSGDAAYEDPIPLVGLS